MPFTVAWSDGIVQKNFHGLNYYITEITLSTSSLAAFQDDIFWYIHGIGMFIAWNLFVLIGYISARFLRHYPWWIIFHYIGGALPSLFSFAIIIASIVKSILFIFISKLEKYQDVEPVTDSIHIIYGLVFFAILITQNILGCISLFGIYCSERVDSDRLLKLKIFHRVTK